MPDTFQALAVVVLALLPGALYTWAFEQQAGPWGTGLSDRVLRFIGSSALLHAFAAPITYQLWRLYIEPGTVAHGQPLPWWMWVLPIVYVVVPILLGRLIGIGARKRLPWVRLITGPAPAPTAWDHVFSTGDLEAWVRLKLIDGTWLGGAYAGGSGNLQSYAAGYPQSRDLFLAATASVDPDTGEFELDEDGRPQDLGAGLLVRWDQVAYAHIEVASEE